MGKTTMLSLRKTSTLALLSLFLATPAGWAWSQIYKITDDEDGVVFTDKPDSMSGGNAKNVEKVDIGDINTAAPVEVRPAPSRSSRAEAEQEADDPTVTITSPVDETTIAMGPGNFAVSASATPPLTRGERLVLMVDGQPYGAAQSSSSWFVEGAMRGPHDLVVQRTTTRGTTIATSEPVRVYVLRPSIR